MSLAPFDTTTLVFQVPGTYATDPATGNWVASTTPETYTAALRDRSMPDYLVQTGVDATTVYLEGTLLYPNQWSAHIRPGMIAQATWQGLKGRFELYPSSMPGFETILRQPVRGLFRMIGGGSNVN